jgi:hypothetical protein
MCKVRKEVHLRSKIKNVFHCADFQETENCSIYFSVCPVTDVIQIGRKLCRTFPKKFVYTRKQTMTSAALIDMKVAALSYETLLAR